MEQKTTEKFEIFSREELKEIRGGDGTYYGGTGNGYCWDYYYDNNTAQFTTYDGGMRCNTPNDCVGTRAIERMRNGLPYFNNSCESYAY